MRTTTALSAAGETDPGLQRDVNEDRFHVDVSRGLFIVVDGVGGQAAGGKAADVAMEMLRSRLERETGPVVDRIREAITVANNEIHRAAATRPEWNGMACVLTVAVVEEHRATIGHVGDTRLYVLRNGHIDKVTRDHSPVGEREDAQEISETEAMRHPRRNEVYRDVGSERHAVDDPDFIDVHEISFAPDEALLMCSDGLTDLVDSTTIYQTVRRLAGQPQQVAKALVQAANKSGGKDNVTVVYVEGEQFAARPGAAPANGSKARAPVSALAPALPDTLSTVAVAVEPAAVPSRSARVVRLSLIALIAIVLGFLLLRMYPSWAAPITRWLPSMPRSLSDLTRLPGTIVPPILGGGPATVRPGESIAAALASAQPGSSVLVEPGEYRETLVLRDGVRVVSQVPRGATIRLPGGKSEGDRAVVADGVKGAELVGFRIVGDSATPLGTGVFAKDATLSLVDVEITGAVTVAIDVADQAQVSVVGSDVHDNPGTAMAIRAGVSSRISHSFFARNGLSERVGTAFVIEAGAQPHFVANMFIGIGAETFRGLGDAARSRLLLDNWFPDAQDARTPPAAGARGGRRGR